jgi:hypothetical protein
MKTFKEFKEEPTNEAMVQVAGKGKPAGAMILSKMVLQFLKDGKYLSSTAERELIALEAEVAQVIMDNTF